jgi:formate dehydrogenase subunit gamma
MAKSLETGAAEIAEIVAVHAHRRGALLPILHAVQARFAHVPEAATAVIAEGLNLSRAEVHGAIGFYPDFRRQPPPEHVIRLCRSEACQARGARAVEQAAALRLGIAMGERRADVALEAVHCLGLCPIGPAGVIDGRLEARLSPERVAHWADELDL